MSSFSEFNAVLKNYITFPEDILIISSFAMGSSPLSKRFDSNINVDDYGYVNGELRFFDLDAKTGVVEVDVNIHIAGCVDDLLEFGKNLQSYVKQQLVSPAQLRVWLMPGSIGCGDFRDFEFDRNAKKSEANKSEI